MTILHTARLRLEPISMAHFDGLRAMNSDAEVMRYITGKPDTEADTLAGIERIGAAWQRFGYSWWAWIDKDSGELAGAGCIQHLNRDPAQPLEIGWRLRKNQWGKGLATEAAVCMANFAFHTLQGELLTAICDPANHASSHVMKKLGMQYRGLERWYETDVDTYVIHRQDWLASALNQPALAAAASKA